MSSPPAIAAAPASLVAPDPPVAPGGPEGGGGPPIELSPPAAAATAPPAAPAPPAALEDGGPGDPLSSSPADAAPPAPPVALKLPPATPGGPKDGGASDPLSSSPAAAAPPAPPVTLKIPPAPRGGPEDGGTRNPPVQLRGPQPPPPQHVVRPHIMASPQMPRQFLPGPNVFAMQGEIARLNRLLWVERNSRRQQQPPPPYQNPNNEMAAQLADMKKLNKELTSQICYARGQYKTIKEDKEYRDLTTLRETEEHSAELQTMLNSERKQHKEEVKKLLDRLTDKITQHCHQINDMRDKHQEQINEINDQHQEQLNSLQHDLEVSQNENQQWQQEHELRQHDKVNDKILTKKEWKKQLAHLQDENFALQAELAKEREDQTEQIQATIQAKMTEERKEYKEEIKKLKQTIKEAKEDAAKKLKEQRVKAKERLTKEHELVVQEKAKLAQEKAKRVALKRKREATVEGGTGNSGDGDGAGAGDHEGQPDVSSPSPAKKPRYIPKKELEAERASHKAAIRKLKEEHQLAVGKVRQDWRTRMKKEQTKAQERLSKSTKAWVAQVNEEKAKIQELKRSVAALNGDNGGRKVRPSGRGSGKQSSLSDEKNGHVQIWKRNFEALKAFREEFGHCNVPTSYVNTTTEDGTVVADPSKRRLFNFVCSQRMGRTRLTQGKPSHLTVEKIQLLDSIGFQWRVAPEKLRWEDRMQQLTIFHRDHGHCNVPQNFKKHGIETLGEFVLNIRRRYREGKLELAKQQELEALGFQWSLRNRGGTLEERMAVSRSLGSEEVDHLLEQQQH